MKKYILMPVIGLILLGGLIYLFKKDSLPGGEVACTAEAMVCPDGTTVGRSGPNCEFVACPNQDEYVGQLMRDDGGFILTMDQHNGTGKTEIPLSLKISNALRDLEGSYVRVTGVYTAGSLLQVNSIEEIDTGTAKIPVGTWKTVGGISVIFNELVQDNRCPVDAQCIEAGGVTANVTLSADGENKVVNIASDDVPYEFKGHTIAIVGVAPGRLSGQEPAPESYMITVKVE